MSRVGTLLVVASLCPACASSEPSTDATEDELRRGALAPERQVIIPGYGVVHGIVAEGDDAVRLYDALKANGAREVPSPDHNAAKPNIVAGVTGSELDLGNKAMVLGVRCQHGGAMCFASGVVKADADGKVRADLNAIILEGAVARAVAGALPSTRRAGQSGLGGVSCVSVGAKTHCTLVATQHFGVARLEAAPAEAERIIDASF